MRINQEQFRNMRLPEKIKVHVLKKALQRTYKEISYNKAYVSAKTNDFLRRVHYMINNELVPIKVINDVSYAMLDKDSESLLNSFLKLETYIDQHPEKFI